MGSRSATTYILEELLTQTGDRLVLPGESEWYVSEHRCPCGDDNGIRYDSVYSPPFLPDACEGCGNDIPTS